MSAVTLSSADGQPRRLFGGGAVLIAMALAATALSCFMNIGSITEVWHGRLGDPDDAMRLVEARSWLAGQSWFDMTATRLDPPHGSFMHWSRLVDLPVAGLIRLFGLVLAPTTAERLALIAVPLVWLVALYAGMARLATLLVGQAGRLPAILGTMFSGAVLVQFAPGRIGHHAPETVALVFAVGCAIAAIDQRRSKEGFVAGGLVALSLAMSLETMPFLIVLIGVLTAFWIWEGSKLAPMLLRVSGGLLVALPLCFLATVGPDRWLQPVCDAYGAAHVGGGLIGAAGLFVLASASPRLPQRLFRVAAAAAIAGLAAAFVALAFPRCLQSPFAAVDPLVRALWLDHVVESLPLTEFLRRNPILGLAIICPIALGAAGNVFATIASHGTERLRFMLISVLSVFGMALAFWQVRVLAAATPLALCGGVFLAVRLRDVLMSRGLSVAARLAPVTILPFTSTAWAVALPQDMNATTDRTAACLSPEALAPLADLPPGAAIAPINAGSHLLERTKLTVFAAPYHRNDDGNRFALEVFLASTERARELIGERHARYVIACPGMASEDRLAKQAPNGLAALLAKGQVPGFLRERRLGATPYRVFEVDPAP